MPLLRHNSYYGGYSQGKQRLKRCVFRRLRKTDSDGADMTCCGLFQTQGAATGKARLPIVDNRVRRTISDGDEAERRRRLRLPFEVRRLAKFIGKVRWCCFVQTLVDKESEIEVNSLPCRTTDTSTCTDQRSPTNIRCREQLQT